MTVTHVLARVSPMSPVCTAFTRDQRRLYGRDPGAGEGDARPLGNRLGRHGMNALVRAM